MVIGASVTGASVIGASVVGASVISATVISASVISASIIGASENSTETRMDSLSFMLSQRNPRYMADHRTCGDLVEFWE